MISTALRDLVWRRRRFLISIVGTAMVFTMTLILSALAFTFRSEVSRTVDALAVESWVIPADATGPFTGVSIVPSDLASSISEEASPLIVGFAPVTRPDGTVQDTNVFGHVPGKIGSPPVEEGRGLAAPGEIVIDASSNIPIGEKVRIGNSDFTVVGRTHGLTFNLGIPNLYIDIADVQRLLFGGRPLATTIAVNGSLENVPGGFKAIPQSAVIADLLRPLHKAVRAIDLASGFLWIVAAMIIGSVIYLTALERRRDFAVMKATGASNGYVFGGLAVQALVVSLLSGVLAIVGALILIPVFPLPLVVPVGRFGLLIGVAVGVGLLASAFGARQAISVDPALAFGGP